MFQKDKIQSLLVCPSRRPSWTTGCALFHVPSRITTIMHWKGLMCSKLNVFQWRAYWVECTQWHTQLCSRIELQHRPTIPTIDWLHCWKHYKETCCLAASLFYLHHVSWWKRSVSSSSLTLWLKIVILEYNRGYPLHSCKIANKRGYSPSIPCSICSITDPA